MKHANFDSHWLELREPVDHRSRSKELVLLLANYWMKQKGRRILDLGSGMGSNLRYLSPYLGNKSQHWTLLDHDSSLLEMIEKPIQKHLTISPFLGDLREDGLQLIRDHDLVTGSALLDLTSRGWLDKLTEKCAKQSCPVYFSLSYTGEVSWHSTTNKEGDVESLEHHSRICNIFNRHQLRDKGTGPALGPSAVSRLNQLFKSKGYVTKCYSSPWVLDYEDRELKKLLIQGWMHSALEECPEESEMINSWAHSSLRLACSSNSILRVSHLDFLALPNTTDSP